MKKFFIVLLIIAIALPMVFATGQKEAKESSDVTTITFWNFPNFSDDSKIAGNFDKELIKAFEEKNPNIKVTLELINFNDGPAKIEAALASNTAPDIVYDAPGRIINWGNTGSLVELNDLINKDVSKNLVKSSTGLNGKVYMYPINTAPFTMAFNKTMLEDFNLLHMLPYQGDRTWTVKQYEDLLKAIKAKLTVGMTPGVFYCKSQAGDQGTRAYCVNFYGGTLLNDDLSDYNMNGANSVKTLKWIKKAVDNGLLLNGSALAAGDAIDMFCMGKAAHTILYSVGLEKINADRKDYKGKDFEVIYMPFPMDNKPPVLEYLVAGPCIFNNKDAARIEASKKFVDFMANDPVWGPKVVAATGTFSANANQKIESNDPEILWNASASKFFGPYYNTIKGYVQMRTYWFPALQAIINGQDAQTVLDDFVKKSNATLK